MSLILRQVVFAGFLLQALSCASEQGMQGGTASPAGNPITQNDLAAREFGSAYEAIRVLRPAWLRPRAAPPISGGGSVYPAVYVDRIMANSGFQALHDIPTGDISEIQFLGPRDATTLFGTGHMGGAILLFTRRGI